MAQQQGHASRVLDEIERLIETEPEADAVLRRAVDVLAETVERYAYVCLSFVEAGELVRGPWRGQEPAGEELGGGLAVPVIHDGSQVGELRVDPAQSHTLTEADESFLDRVAQRLSAHCLVGWDTGGVPWSEVE